MYPGSRRRLAVREGDELEGVDDDRLRAALQPCAGTRRPRALRRRVRRGLGTAAAEHGAHRRAEPRPVRRRAARAARSSPRRPTARRSSMCAPSTAFAAGHLPGALNVPVSGTRFATKAAFVLDAGPVTSRRRTTDEAAARDPRACTRSAILDIAGLRPRRRHRDARARLDRRARRAPRETGAELIDVREKDERDSGYIAGSRNIPYRLLALGEADLPRDKPIVTICETGPRAAIAASILAARGFDAHPVVNGGIDSWARRRQADGRVPPLRQLTQLAALGGTRSRSTRRYRLRGADRLEQLLAVLLVARRDVELDLRLRARSSSALRGGGRPRRRCRALARSGRARCAALRAIGDQQRGSRGTGPPPSGRGAGRR